MISGERTPSLLSLLLTSVLCGGAGAADTGTELTLPGLFERLAANPQTRTRFVEIKRLSVLDRPLRFEGTMEFRKPDYLAKHVMTPVAEDYVIEGEKVTVTQSTGGSPLELVLSDHPALDAFAASLQAPLAGDLESLTRHWRPSLGGSRKKWLLALTPIQPQLAALIRTVRLEGREDRLTAISIEETSGDSSVLSFSPLP
jgi:hypothetical protein